VVDKYLFVGILEEYEDTLRVLEKLLPVHFKGIIDVLHNPGTEQTNRQTDRGSQTGKNRHGKSVKENGISHLIIP
jgi:hypothetical protein